MLLTDRDIIQAMKEGHIHIDPFHPEDNLNNCSYDLTLGPHIYRCIKNYEKLRPAAEDYYPIDWYEYEDCSKRREILLAPGECILGHSIEFAGTLPSKTVAYNSMIHGTSRAARFFISVCDDAGWGDVGFFNRWTLEIRNKSNRRLVLPVGAKIAQIAFIKCVSVPNKFYHEIGSFQKHSIIEEVRDTWNPVDMLPKKMKVNTKVVDNYLGVNLKSVKG